MNATTPHQSAEAVRCPSPIGSHSVSPSGRTRHEICVIAMIVALCFATGAWGADDTATRSSEKLGRVLFKTSCSPQAQKQFERALAMLHSFFYPETVKAFSAIPQKDPSCAIAYWGIAVSTRPNPLVSPFDAATLKRGLEAVEKGKAIGAKTQRERDWLAAIEAFYKDHGKVDQDTRAKNYEEAMKDLQEGSCEVLLR